MLHLNSVVDGMTAERITILHLNTFLEHFCLPRQRYSRAVAHLWNAHHMLSHFVTIFLNLLHTFDGKGTIKHHINMFLL